MNKTPAGQEKLTERVKMYNSPAKHTRQVNVKTKWHRILTTSGMVDAPGMPRRLTMMVATSKRNAARA